MSPSDVPPDAAPVRLSVTTRDRASDIVVIDSTLAVVERGTGELTAELRPGLYKVRALAGGVLREQYAVLAPGTGSVSVAFDQVRLESAAPLTKSRKSHEYHMHAAQAHSLPVHVDLGGDSQIFLFLRDFEVAHEPPPERTLCASVWLTSAEGESLVDLAGVGACAPATDSDGWYACNIRLPAGTYRVACGSDDGYLAMTVVAAPGWQTQVFLLRTRNDGKLCIGFHDAAVFISRLGRGFHFNDEDLRLAELARHGLMNGRPVLPTSEVMRLADGKFDDPMLGILAAHLLLLTRKGGDRGQSGRGESDPRQDSQVLATIVGNLRHLLGVHPDVEAVAHAIGLPVDPHAFFYPPGLVRSWWLILDASASSPELVPLDSVASQIATRVWGSGPCLVWREPTSRPAAVIRSHASDQDLSDELRGRYVRLRALADRDDDELTGAEQALLEFLAPPPRPRRDPGLGLSFESLAPNPRYDPAKLVRVTGLPPSTLRDVLESLYHKTSTPEGG